jgi:hypothetical protein
MMDTHQGIILCQPDGKKGCSACCGLFNHRSIDRKFLSAVLEKNTENKTRACFMHASDEETGLEPVRDRGSYTCPFQGFLAPGKPGCLIHPGVNPEDMRDRSFFGKKICDAFLCPAHMVLSDPEKKDLVELVDDWYYYSVAVIDPESFSWIIRNAREACGGNNEPALLKGLVLSALRVHAEQLDEYPGPVFCYALPEYNLAKKKYYLQADNEKAAVERDSIKKTMARLVEEAGR